MEIKTKFNIGDKVYFMNYENPTKATICGINTYSEQEITHITYSFKGTSHLTNEENIYTTKEELQKFTLSSVEERFKLL